MRSRIKQGLRITAFLLILCIGIAAVNRFFLPGQDFRSEKLSFYEEPKDSLDVIFVGSSSCLRSVSPMQMYIEHGFRSYSLATVLQAAEVSAFVTREALRRQTPRVMVFGLDSYDAEYDHTAREAYLHMAMDPFRLSPDKIRCAVEIGRRDQNQSALDYLLPIARYHDAWKTDAGQDILRQTRSFRKGFLPISGSVEVAPDPQYMVYSGTAPELNQDALGFYREMLAFCAKRNIPALIVKYPRMTWTMEEHDSLASFAAENGAAFLDFNLPEWWERTGLSLREDFYDPNHVCTTGAEKLTRALGEYLCEHYDLPDRTGESPTFDACVEEYLHSVAWCIHTEREGDRMTLTVSGTETGEDLSFCWTVIRNGAVIAEQTGEDSALSIPWPGGGIYSISCRILRGETEIGRAEAQDWSLE